MIYRSGMNYVRNEKGLKGMSDRAKEIILKTLTVVVLILIALIFPGLLIFSYFVAEETLMYMFNVTVGAFFLVGFLLMVLLPVFGGIKQKPTKAEKFPMIYNDYNEFDAFLSKSLLNKGYFEQGLKDICTNGMLKVYIKSSKVWQIDCVSVMRFDELTDEIIEICNDGITEIISEYYKGKAITDKVNMISVICVNRITPSFQKFVNSNLEQGVKNGRLYVGISFGGKQIYIAQQKDGFAIMRYKKLRKEFLGIMELSGFCKAERL